MIGGMSDLPTEPGATPLAAQRCVPCTGATPTLGEDEVREALRQLPRWKASADGRAIERSVTFRAFPLLIAFLPALGELAEAEGHHPDFCCSYTRLSLRLTTHAIGGLSLNDVILAAKIDALLDERRGQLRLPKRGAEERRAATDLEKQADPPPT